MKVTKMDMVRVIITANFELTELLAEDDAEYLNTKKLLLSQKKEELAPLYRRAEKILLGRKKNEKQKLV